MAFEPPLPEVAVLCSHFHFPPFFFALPLLDQPCDNPCMPQPPPLFLPERPMHIIPLTHSNICMPSLMPNPPQTIIFPFKLVSNSFKTPFKNCINIHKAIFAGQG